MSCVPSPPDAPARAAFDRLRPFHSRIVRLQSCCRPFAGDYMVLDAVKQRLVAAATEMLAEPDFFSLRPPRS